MNGKISSFRFIVLALAAATAGCIGTSPLIEAVKVQDQAKTEKLLAGPGPLDLEKTDSTYKTALWYAIRNKDNALIDKLLAKGAKPQSGLKEALDWGDEAVIRNLVKKGATLKSSLLFLGAKKGNIGFSTFLFDLAAANDSKVGFLRKISTVLYHAANEKENAIAEFALARGADVDSAIALAVSQEEFEEKWVKKAKYKRMRENSRRNAARARETQAWLRTKTTNKSAQSMLLHTEGPNVAKFYKDAAARYRALAVKPALPEKARRFKVQAEEAVKDKRFERAIERYGQALAIAPWWPEGHFNRALILGETRRYTEAIREMRRYLTLVPNAADARKAQDKIYAWEDK